MSDWRPIDSAPEGKMIETKVDDAGGLRKVQPLFRTVHTWRMPPFGFNVHYTPTHWRPIR